jgi:uroporphyrinogen decarboxylase
MDAVTLRKKYGKDLILSGNIDKRVFTRGKAAIKEEVMSKVPFLVEGGAYFPSLDHGIPPDVPLEDFRYYINLLREIGGRDKLPT